MEQSSSRVCCIHSVGVEGSILPFTQVKLEKCHQVMNARKYHKLGMTQYCIPREVDDRQGYHCKCYSRFTAIRKSYLQCVPDFVEGQDAEPVPSTSSKSPVIKRPRRENILSTSGVLKPVCVFCGKVRLQRQKKNVGLILTQTKNFERKVIDAAQKRKDFKMLGIISGGDFVANEVRYHKVCSRKYIYAANKNESTAWHSLRESHKQAFQFLCQFVSQHILLKEEVITLKEMYKIYVSAVQNARGGGAFDLVETKKYPARHLRCKILKHFAGSIYSNESGKDVIFYKSSMDFAPAIIEKKINAMKKMTKLRDAAYALRNEIFSIQKNPIPDLVTVDSIKKGECTVPETILQFFEDVLHGPSPTSTSTRGQEAANIRANSMAQDLIFNVTKGHIKPEKHLTLGCALKTITGSRKAINILNRFGHTSSYTTIEELETEMSYTAQKESSIFPNVLRKMSNLCTGVAFNNFDRYVETTTGKSTLHDTVGIVYQNIVGDYLSQPLPESLLPSLQVSQDAVEGSSGGMRRRRAFDEICHEVQPYIKTPKTPIPIDSISSHNPLPLPERRQSFSNFNDSRLIDIMWALNFYYEIENTPMWVGYNSSLFIDQLPQQEVSYLPQINASPTSYSVVRHTMNTALKLAEECGQDSIICTYDLSIAKMAMQIKNEEKPSFESLFVFPGTFHIELAFFKAIGKIIADSGITEILENAGIIASGSLMGFIGGTHYNRCKSIHSTLALALRLKNYHNFISGLQETQTVGEFCDKHEIKQVLVNERAKTISPTERIHIDKRLEQILQQYRAFEESRLAGEHGKTAQFWMLYVSYIDIYNDFIRSVRMGDLDLFKKSLALITDLFFCLNHHNYCRWNVHFMDNLDRVVQTDSDAAKQLNSGIFGIRRTSKNFSRSPIDLTLEQTINAHAGNKLTGITSFTNSISARQRWAVSHSQRTDIVSHVMSKSGLTKKEDVSEQLKPHRISKSSERLQSLLQSLESYLDPFKEQNDFLVNICTGKSVSDSTADFLLSIMRTGRTLHENFRQECVAKPARFYEAIKQNKLLTFSSETIKLKISKSDKTKELKFERNLFAKLLSLSVSNNIDLKTVMTFPLTPVPLALAHNDGTAMKTNKSSLFRYLEQKTDHDIPQKVDKTIIDGFYYFHKLGINLPTTFGGIASALLKNFRSLRSEKVYLVFDEYVSPSIKDQERIRRATGLDSRAQYTIQAAGQKRPTDFIKALRNESFKKALVAFLLEEWKNPEYAHFFIGMSLFANGSDEFYSYTCTAQQDAIRSGTVPRLNNTHHEADCKMVYLLTTFTEGTVVIKSSDTDVLIATIGNLHHISAQTAIYIETGSAQKNTMRYINVRKIADHLGAQLSQALPAFHALTGCDYTSSFFRLGKVKPFKKVESDTTFQAVLATFGQNETLTDEDYKQMECIVRSFYTKKVYENIDDLRFDTFMDTYSKKQKSSIIIPKGIDGSSMPPCRRVLRQQVLRCKFVTIMWTSLNNPQRSLISPLDYGWFNDNGSFNYRWFKGPALPSTLEEILLDEPDKADEADSQDESLGTDSDTDDANTDVEFLM